MQHDRSTSARNLLPLEVNNGNVLGVNKLQEILVFQIKAAMKMRKMSQKKLAEQAGCSERHLSNLLSGKTQGTLGLWDTLLKVLEIPGYQRISPE